MTQTKMENKLKEYYLGTLSEEESEKIDLRLMEDAEFEEALLLAKNDLMEDFLDESLSAGEIESFQKNFLKTELRKKELKNLALLRSYARRKQAEKFAKRKTADRSASFFDGLNSFVSAHLRPLAAGFAALIVFSAAGLYFLNSTGGLSELNSKDFSNIDEYRNLTKLNLAPGMFRNANAAVKLPAEKLTDPVFLLLALPPEGEFFDVNIVRNEKKIASNLRLRSYSNQNGQELRLLLSASDLTKGDYKIEVFPANAPSVPAVYTFTIQ